MTQLVLRHDADGMAVLTLNRPEKLNALSIALFRELGAHVERLARETETVGLVVLRGGGRCFSAGHDLRDPEGHGKSDPNLQANIVEALASLPQPVISAVHGFCYTGALELALAGDIIFASENALFADTHARWGLTPVWGLSQRLPRRVGASKAAEMMFTCREISGAEAASIGLANVCVPHDRFESELDGFCRTVLVNSWFSHRANKALMRETDGLPLALGLSHEIHRSRGRAPDSESRLTAFPSSRKKA